MAVPLTLSEVPNVAPYIQYIATNGQTVYPYPFPITQDSDLLVIINGVTQATDSTYSLSGQGNALGGNVTLNTGSKAGDIITLSRDVQIDRITQISQNSGFASSTFNAEFNNIYLILQQLETAIGFCLQIPNTNVNNPVTTLTPAVFANKYLSFDANGNPAAAALVSGSVTAALIGSLITPPTTAELAVAAAAPVVNGFYPPGNVLRYGIVPNSTAARASNTVILKALLDYNVSTGPTGTFTFPNTTGADVYSFGGVALVRPGVRIDLCGSTLNNTYTAAAGDALTGLFFVIRDFEIFNGSITTNVDTTAAAGSGACIQMGGRTNSNTYITIFDSLLAHPMGHIHVHDLRFTYNNTGVNVNNAIQAIGGLVNCKVENVSIDGGGVALGGFYYEWGWATSPSGAGAQTSHAHNLVLRNVKVQNCTTGSTGTGSAIGITGAYNYTLDGIYTSGSWQGLNLRLGEALFFNSWVGVDDAGAKRGAYVRNVVVESAASTGIALIGAELASSGFLSGSGLTPIQQTDLMHYTVDNLRVKGSGIFISAPISGRNLSVTGSASDGITITDDCVQFDLENVDSTSNTGVGIRCNVAGIGVWPSIRQKLGEIRGGVWGGNAGAGAQFSNTNRVRLKRIRLGFNTLYDGVAETTQTLGVSVGTGANGIICDDCYGAPPAGGTTYSITGTTSSACYINNPLGDFSQTGAWGTNGIAVDSHANIISVTSRINTKDKYLGKLCWDNTNKELFMAQGSLASDTWIMVAFGTTQTTLTPV